MHGTAALNAQMGLPPYLRNLRLLTIHDEEYHRIAYMLRASLSSLSVKILSVHAVNSPQQDAIFEGNHIGATVLDSWVNGRDLPEENSIHNIVSHGGRFRITDPNRGGIFTVGTVPIDTSALGGDQHYEFIHCRVATGRSFVVDPEHIGEHGIPAGYDSIVVHKEFESDPTKYFHEYIINDESRIYPDFVVNFVFNVAADRMKQVPMCESCEQAAAVVFCIQDNAKLCLRCDDDMHRTPITSRHSRVKLNEMQTTVGLTMCREHTNTPVQFFDPVAHIPVCIHCKMTGSHSTGEFANHQLVPIESAYNASMEDRDRERTIIEERKKTINAQLGSIERRMQQVNTNHEKAQDHIYEIVQRAVQVLYEETQSKLSALLSDEVELRRQLEYYTWMDSFLSYQQSCVNPVEFLQIFHCHSSILAQAPSEIVDGASSVKADIRILGRIEVVVDDTSVTGSAAAPADARQQRGAQPQGALPPAALQQQMPQQQAPRGRFGNAQPPYAGGKIGGIIPADAPIAQRTPSQSSVQGGVGAYGPGPQRGNYNPYR